MCNDQLGRRRGTFARWMGGAALWAVCLGAPCAAAAEGQPLPDRLLPLIDDLETQLHLTYDFDQPVHRQRVQYTRSVVRAWQRSRQTPRDAALLEGWLHDAIERSLPGRRAPLARVPAFSHPAEHLRSPVASSRRADAVNTAPSRPTQEPARSIAPSIPPTSSPAGPPQLALKPEPSAIRPPVRRRTEPPIDASMPDGIDDLPHALPAKSSSRPADSPAARRSTTETPADGPARTPVATSELASSATGTGALPRKLADEVPGDPGIRPQQTGRHATPVDVELNLSEYAARVAGHRMGLRSLEARMLELTAPTADDLARLVGELESLHHQASFLTLYTAILSEEMKASVGSPVSAANASTALQNLIERRLAALQNHPQAQTRHAREINLLKRLTDRLAHLSPP